jgi:hypothetical protein
MTDHIDEFESIFKRSEKVKYEYQELKINSVLLISDQNESSVSELKNQAQKFLPSINSNTNWNTVTGEQFSNVGDLLRLLQEHSPDMVITYRHLQEESLIPQHSLGVYVDVLTQVIQIPILLLPGTAQKPKSLDEMSCQRVMIVTDHIRGDSNLINYGVKLCTEQGTVWLCHIEDDLIFQRYLNAISRIPEIETQQAEELIQNRLLDDASEFIDSCIQDLSIRRPDLTYQSSVGLGHHLKIYRDLVNQQNINLLIFNTKDEDQLAMHGLGYSMSIEFTDRPLLLL